MDGLVLYWQQQTWVCTVPVALGGSIARPAHMLCIDPQPSCLIRLSPFCFHRAAHAVAE